MGPPLHQGEKGPGGPNAGGPPGPNSLMAIDAIPNLETVREEAEAQMIHAEEQ